MRDPLKAAQAEINRCRRELKKGGDHVYWAKRMVQASIEMHKASKLLLEEAERLTPPPPRMPRMCPDCGR